MKQLILDRSKVEITVPVTSDSSSLTMSIVRRGDDSVSADMDLFTFKDGVARFRTNDSVHMLPFGLYKAVVMSNNCVCSELPVQIPKCSTGLAKSIDGCNEPTHLPDRECIEEVCGALPCEEESVCELMTYECGNEVDKITQTTPDISLTDVANTKKEAC